MTSEKEIQLIEPSEELREAYLDYVAAFSAAEEGYTGSVVELKDDFGEFVQLLQDYAKGANLPKGWVSASTYWLVCGGRILGTSDLRHRLTEALKDEGGHIGYAVRPSERGKGYGTLMVKLVLEKARQLGLRRVLITCDKGNLASARVIQKNGGQLDSESVSTESGKMKQRYWIEL